MATAALMLAHLGWKEEAARTDSAIFGAVGANQTTVDIGGTLGTRESAAAIVKRIETA